MRDIDWLWSLRVPEIRRPDRLENARGLSLDDKGNDREMPGPETNGSDEPVLRIHRLLKKYLSTLGAYHRAAIVPNEAGS